MYPCAACPFYFSCRLKCVSSRFPCWSSNSSGMVSVDWERIKFRWGHESGPSCGASVFLRGWRASFCPLSLLHEDSEICWYLDFGLGAPRPVKNKQFYVGYLVCLLLLRQIESRLFYFPIMIWKFKCLKIRICYNLTVLWMEDIWIISAFKKVIYKAFLLDILRVCYMYAIADSCFWPQKMVS